MPQAPARVPPVDHASHFLSRYALDTLARIKAFARVRARGREALVRHGDSRELDWDGRFDAVITSPPYPGLIDYHEQHRYAYELLGLDDRREHEIGAAAAGTSKAALAAYCDGIAATLRRAADALHPGAPRADRRQRPARPLSGDPVAARGLQLRGRLRRHVNRRTGRRAGEYFEDVLVAVPE